MGGGPLRAPDLPACDASLATSEDGAAVGGTSRQMEEAAGRVNDDTLADLCDRTVRSPARPAVRGEHVLALSMYLR